MEHKLFVFDRTNDCFILLQRDATLYLGGGDGHAVFRFPAKRPRKERSVPGLLHECMKAVFPERTELHGGI